MARLQGIEPAAAALQVGPASRRDPPDVVAACGPAAPQYFRSAASTTAQALAAQAAGTTEDEKGPSRVSRRSSVRSSSAVMRASGRFPVSSGTRYWNRRG